MTDVRLTALNPVDSQVYPVACNTSGELLVAGDSTEYVEVAGDNMTGNLTLGTDKITLDASTGTATCEGLVTGASFASDAEVLAKGLPGDGLVYLANQADTVDYGYLQYASNGTDIAASIAASGSGFLSGNLNIDTSNIFDFCITATNSSTPTTFGTIYARNNGSAGSPCYQAVDSAGNVQARTNNDGSATFSGTVTATVVPPSDARFKENITAAKPQLGDVVALGELLKNYNWYDEAPVNDAVRAQRQLGLIAQEVDKVCPNLVKELGTDDNRYFGIPMEALIMKLIGAVSELKTELDQLKNK